jgi:hypothetical protein
LDETEKVKAEHARLLNSKNYCKSAQIEVAGAKDLITKKDLLIKQMELENERL